MSELQKTAFDQFFLSVETLRALEAIGYTKPTPVQTSSIPLVMAGIDLVVQSQTGTGKTAAFAIPTIEMLEPKAGRIDVLVLAPTRELAAQVSKEFTRLSIHKPLEVATVYGGASYNKQYEDLATASVVCATPGRLLDILQRGNLDLSNLRILCLDEADEMLSMGFAEELDAILKFLPEERQSLLFSATITPEVKALSGSMLYYPEFVSHSEDSVAATDVEHLYYSVNGVGRARDLLKVIEFEAPETAIIFCNTRSDTFMVTRFLKRHGRRAEALNGDLAQKDRERTLGLLRQGKIDYLVATDVAARGIDISDLSHVINYTLPDSAEVYIHRTGRTGRAGKKGRAVSLVSPREMGTLFGIKKLYTFPLIQHSVPTPHQILEVNQHRRLVNLASDLDAVGGLSYGSKLGVAQSLIEGGEDQVKLVACLLSLAESVLAGRTFAKAKVEPAPEVVEAADAVEDIAPVEELEAAEIVEAVEVAETVVETAAEAEVEAAAEVETDTTDEAPRRRGRRGRGRRGKSDEDKAEKPQKQETAPEAASEESEDTPRRRRRRRRSDDAPKEEVAAVEAAPSAAPARKNGEEKRRSGSRGNDRGRGGRRGKRRPEREHEEVVLAEPARLMSKLWVNVGKNHVESSTDVVEMVCYMAGMEPEDFGKIYLENSYSYVEVREDYFYDTINALNNQDWNGVTVSAEPARK